jgi:hypothetical protein
MKGIRASSAYWNAAKLDLLSMINAKGPMTWFLTLSATDMNWDDLMSVLCKQEGLPFSKDHICALSRKEKSKLEMFRIVWIVLKILANLSSCERCLSSGCF